MLDDFVEQRDPYAGALLRSLRRPALLADENRVGKSSCVLVRVQRGKKIEGLVMHLDRRAFGFVHLVDQHDRAQAEAQCLANHELGLRHRPFGRIHQHDDAVDHAEDTLHLATEIGVAGGVDDVDAGAFPVDAGAFRQNGDAAFAFLIVAVHRPLGHAWLSRKVPDLRQQAVDQRGLAMVDVRDDRNIADIHAGGGFPIAAASQGVRDGSSRGG